MWRARTGPSRAPRLAALRAAACLLLAAPRAARAAEQGVGGALLLRQLKQLQHATLLAEPAARRGRLRRAAARRLGKEVPRENLEPGARPAGRAGVALPYPVAGIPANLIVNDRQLDHTGFAAQSEVTLAALGPLVVAAWNDGGESGGNGIGWGWSVDGGAVWRDGGVPPVGNGLGIWLTDPVLAVDEKRGTFYLCGVGISSSARNAIALVKGRFSDTTFAWEPPVLVRAVRDTLPDKPWIAADSSSGNVYLTYTSFSRVADRQSDQVELQRSTDGGASWSPPAVLSSPADRGLVQGGRPAVGPAGEVHVAWIAVDTSAVADGLDHLRVRRSDDGGATFAGEVTAASLFANFGSGAPGFNRGYGFAFPGIAVDRSRGPHRGRVYLAWNESVDFFADPLGGAGTRPELEGNNSPASATPFVVGETLTGSISAANDVDHFAFGGEQGRTAVFFVDSAAAGLDLSFRVLCADGVTRLAYNAPSAVRQRMLIFTLPQTGTYYLRLAPNDLSAGDYRIRTGFHSPRNERARDQRDVFVAWSDDEGTWCAPRRVNDDDGHFDDWLPEIAVTPDGTAFVAWYDWRDASAETCGGVSSIHLARSDDGGAAWQPSYPLTDAATAWTYVSSNIAPNQGDYIALVSEGETLRSGWADGRFGDPDVFTVALATPARITVAGLEASPGRVVLSWDAPAAGGTRATLYRRTALDEWSALAGLVADGAGRMSWADSTAAPGRRYGYRLGVAGAGGERFAVETWVDVPEVPPRALALERVRPNPARADLFVQFALPLAAPALLELLDPAGRRLRALEVGGLGAGRHVVNLGNGPALTPGLYFVRLSQRGAAAATKVVVAR
ncbi:MAG: exo-alpha-sialidase [Candidatus Eisenbacteria bacterium]|nr:exo-alpha-sialidase [Candidatus Eisenbacteria bacterium]